jgi:hypothetical protein
MSVAVELQDNIAAISAQFHMNNVAYSKFYQKHGEAMGGFPAIWRFCVEAADAFTQVEFSVRSNTECRREWIDAVDLYVAGLLAQEKLPGTAELMEMAEDALLES